MKVTKGSAAPQVPSRSIAIDSIQSSLRTTIQTVSKVRFHERLLAEAGVRLDRAGFSLLAALYKQAGPQRVSALAELLQVDAPTVTRKVQQLEHVGLVERQSDPEDGRATLIGVTEEGQACIGQLLAAYRRRLEVIFDQWPIEDVATLAALLARMNHALLDELENDDDH